MTISASSLSARPAAAGAVAAFAAGLKASLVGRWRAWANRRRVRSLLDLDDHLLRDVGLTREDVEAALSSPRDQDASRIVADRARRR